MRIRKEISPWSFKTFFVLFGIFTVVYNLFYFLAGFFSEEYFFDNESIYHWVIMGIANPILLSAIITTTYRSATLYINDYQNIPNFSEKLTAKLLQESLVKTDEKENTLYFSPTGFFSWFNNWFGSEKLTLQLEKEIVIHGSMRKISSIEDVLTWNKDFKS